jgi:PST family polysaccharide transporter
MKLWKKTMPTFLLIIFVLCLSIFLLAEKLTIFLTGTMLQPVSELIRLLSFLPLIVALNIPWYQTLLAFDLKKECLIVLISASLISILLNTILSFLFGAIGTAMALLVTELIISMGLFLMVNYSKRMSRLNLS